MTDIALLADRYAAAKAAFDAAEKSLKTLRKQVLDLGREDLEGEHCYLHVSLQEQTRLDTDAIKAFIGAEKTAELSKTVLIEKIGVKAKVPVALAA